jgi:predicted nucleic acid-binding protein
MKAVFDASALAKTLVDESGSAEAEAALADTEEPISPDWAMVELAQLLWKRSRRGDMSPSQAMDRLDAAKRSAVEFNPVLDEIPLALAIALDQNHSVYDCVYIAAAITEGASLITADARLATIAERCGVPVTLIDALPRA